MMKKNDKFHFTTPRDFVSRVSEIFTSPRDFVYCVYDIVSHYPVGFVIANNDSHAVRKALLTLRCPIRDCILYRIGSFHPLTTVFNMDFEKKPIQVEWSNYRLPESVSDAIAPLGATPEEISEIVSNFAKKNSEVINE